MNFLLESQIARQRIQNHILCTQVVYSEPLSAMTGAEVYFKQENLQITGSFKYRGALNKLLSLTETEMKNGVVAASTGNHGLGVATGLKLLNISGKIFVPDSALQVKVDKIRKLGIEVVIAGHNCEESEAFARIEALKTGTVFISPYNDPVIVAGQGTIGLELHEQSETPWDAVFVSVGGGGLVAGISGVLKTLSKYTAIYGCSPANDAAMAASIKAGKIISIKALPTLSDGTAGGVEAESITFEFCQKLVDEFVLVAEEEIKNSLHWLDTVPQWIVEGAAATALAGFIKIKSKFKNKKVVIILCGGNRI